MKYIKQHERSGEDWVKELQYKLLSSQKDSYIDETIELLYKGLRKFVDDARFDLLDQFISTLKIEDYDIDILGALLTYSYPWKNLLPTWKSTHSLIRKRFYDVLSYEEADEVLSFLK